MLNVSQALRQWQLEQETNQGMMIEVTEATTSNQVHPVALGLITGKQSTDEKEVCLNFFVCNGIRWPLFSYFTLQLTVLSVA